MATRTPKKKEAPASTTRQLALDALEAALDKKALEPVLLDVSKQSSYADYILLLSGRSDRHVQALSDAVKDSLKKGRGRPPIGTEGYREGQWILMDFGPVVVHIFYHPVRDFYDLEGMWADARRVPIDVPPESRIHSDDSYSP
jgi:ribosome-associated protein